MTKHFKYYLALTLLFLNGCSQGIEMLVLFKNIDKSAKTIELEFAFQERIQRIAIYENTNLVLKMENYSGDLITRFIWPSIPEGFKITFPDTITQLPSLSKDRNYTFEFSGVGKVSAHGDWDYLPYFASEEGRWLFDERGFEKDNIKALYEHWVGKDLIYVTLKNEKNVNDSTFLLTNIAGDTLPYELVTKKMPTNKIALALAEGQKKGGRLFLHVSNEIVDNNIAQKGYNKLVIIVPDNSVIGLSGKYNKLK